MKVIEGKPATVLATSVVIGVTYWFCIRFATNNDITGYIGFSSGAASATAFLAYRNKKKKKLLAKVGRRVFMTKSVYYYAIDVPGKRILDCGEIGRYLFDVADQDAAIRFADAPIRIVSKKHCVHSTQLYLSDCAELELIENFGKDLVKEQMGQIAKIFAWVADSTVWMISERSTERERFWDKDEWELQRIEEMML